MPITGRTQLFPIIGHPVADVFSPPAVNSWFESNRLDCSMMALDIPPDALLAFWTLLRASPNMLGCSVTYPHKQAAFAAVDTMTDRAARLGALNTIRRDADGTLHGDATDGQAMFANVSDAQITGLTAHILGAGGGAGAAIVDTLCERGIDQVVLVDSDPARLSAIKASVAQHWPSTNLAQNGHADILVNATTLGKEPGDPLPFTMDEIAAATLVCDVIQGETPLIAAAKKMARATVSGDDMGAGQIASQMAFLGIKP